MASLTKQSALIIISKKTLVTKPGTYQTKYKVSSTTHFWEETNEPYQILNTEITTPYLFDESKKLFFEGKYNEACNKCLTARVSPEKVEELENSGCIDIVIEVDFIELKDGSKALMVVNSKSIKPRQAEKGKKLDMSIFETDEDLKQEEVKKELAEVK
jgi:hypothetical protein